MITDIEVIEVKSRKQGVIEQLLTRGSASITRVEGQNSEGVRKDSLCSKRLLKRHIKDNCSGMVPDPLAVKGACDSQITLCPFES